jgi:hypothetical protein
MNLKVLEASFAQVRRPLNQYVAFGQRLRFRLRFPLTFTPIQAHPPKSRSGRKMYHYRLWVA